VWQCPWPIRVCSHPCKHHPGGTETIAIFLPGVHGGVGPCRTPGRTFDDEALFPTVARRLVSDQGSRVDCYRCSWPFMRPPEGYAVRAAFKVLHHALLQALREAPATPAVEGNGRSGGPLREFRVVFVGHSLGGHVAMQCAEVVASYFGPSGRREVPSACEGDGTLEGLQDAVVRVAGVCTLNGAIDISRIHVGESGVPFEHVAQSRALLICGTDDQVVPPEASAQVYEALSTPNKRLVSLPGGTHDLFGHKAQVIEEVYNFVVECARGTRV